MENSVFKKNLKRNWYSNELVVGWDFSIDMWCSGVVIQRRPYLNFWLIENQVFNCGMRNVYKLTGMKLNN